MGRLAWHLYKGAATARQSRLLEFATSQSHAQKLRIPKSACAPEPCLSVSIAWKLEEAETLCLSLSQFGPTNCRKW
jgi:hypothetical protein